jgi:hypothetical protein
MAVGAYLSKFLDPLYIFGKSFKNKYKNKKFPVYQSERTRDREGERGSGQPSQRIARLPPLLQNVPLHLRHRAPLPPPLHRHRSRTPPPRHGGVRGRHIRTASAAAAVILIPGPQGGARGGEGPRAGGFLP